MSVDFHSQVFLVTTVKALTMGERMRRVTVERAIMIATAMDMPHTCAWLKELASRAGDEIFVETRGPGFSRTPDVTRGEARPS